MYFCISVFVTLAHAASKLKSLNHEIKYKKKIGPRNTLEKKFRTHEKILDPRNTQEKKFQTHEIPTRKKFWTHEIPTRKSFRPTKYQREKFGPTKYPRRHCGTMALNRRDPRQHAPMKFSALKKTKMMFSGMCGRIYS